MKRIAVAAFLACLFSFIAPVHAATVETGQLPNFGVLQNNDLAVITRGGKTGNAQIVLPWSVTQGGTGTNNGHAILDLAIANNLSDVANVALSRQNLGLGSMALQNANAVAITGGTFTGGSIDNTPIGATTPSTGAFTNISIASSSFGDGTVTSPSITFTNDTDTGFYLVGTNYLGITGGAKDIARFNGNDSAVNYWEFAPSLTGSPITVNAYGSDTNIGITVAPKGAGVTTISSPVTVSGTATLQSTASVAAAAAGTAITITGATSGTGVNAGSLTSGTGFAANAVSTGTALSATALSTGVGVNATASTSGIGLRFNTTGAAMTTASALSATGSATMTADYTGAFISVNPTRTMTAAATRAHSGNMLNINPTYSITGSAASIMNVSGPLAALSRTISNASSSGSSSMNMTGAMLALTNTKGTATNAVVDSGDMININQSNATASGALITGVHAGTGYLATFTGTGNFGIGTNAPTSKLHVVGTLNATGAATLGSTLGVTGAITGSSTIGALRFSMHDTAGGDNYLEKYSNDVLAPSLIFDKSRGATVGSYTIVQSGDTLQRIIARGANGTGFTDAAEVRAEVDGTPGATNDMPGRLVFFTTPDGSGTLTERLRIDNAGNVLHQAGKYINFGTTSGTSGYGFFDNGGVLQFKNSGGAWTNFGSSSNFPAGSASTPGFVVATDTNTGLYGASTGVLGISGGGAGIATFGSAGINVISGNYQRTCASGDCSTFVSLSSDNSNNYGTWQNSAGYTRIVQGSGSSSIVAGTTPLLLNAINSYVDIYANNAFNTRFFAAGGMSVGTTTSLSVGSTTTAGVTLNGSRNQFSNANLEAAQVQRTGSDGNIWCWLRQTTAVGCVSVTGSATTYGTSSDQRIKENIVDLTIPDNWLDTLKPRSYDFKKSYTKTSDTLHGTGFVAQELYQTNPDAVVKGDDNANLSSGDAGFKMWSVDAAKLIPPMIVKMKQQDAIIKKQQDSITNLQAANDNLVKQVNAIKAALTAAGIKVNVQ